MTKALDRVVDEPTDLRLAAHVGGNERHFATMPSQLRGELFAGVGPAAGYDDVGACLGIRDRGGSPDAGQRPGDQDRAVSLVHRSRPFIVTGSSDPLTTRDHIINGSSDP